MKVAAHPMLVAVALGLLGPNALAADTVEEDGVTRRPGRAVERAEVNVDIQQDEVMSALEEDSGPYWTRLDLVSDEADAWQSDRDLTLES